MKNNTYDAIDETNLIVMKHIIRLLNKYPVVSVIEQLNKEIEELESKKSTVPSSL